jgi:trehalose/maltose hydrolase-like predicted phosphorylase/phosphoglycolate phosphatase-like HAD superfamily hydrolase
VTPARGEHGETVPLDRAEAWIFSLEQVLVDTGRQRERAWTGAFEGVLGSSRHEAAAGPAHGPSLSREDLDCLAGAASVADGVRSVLGRHGLGSPDGHTNGDGESLVRSLIEGQRRRFRILLGEDPPRPFPSSAAFLGNLRSSGLEVAVVSPDPEAGDVLDLSGLGPWVDLLVDGRAGLTGDPDEGGAPSLYVEAAVRLGVEPRRAVAVPEARAAGSDGLRAAFAAVVVVDRQSRHHPDADGVLPVVGDLGEVLLAGRPADRQIVYDDPAPEQEGTVESLCTLANGYLGTRGSRPWARDDGKSYPGTYLAGTYDRLATRVGERTLETESLVNAPNWLPVTFRIEAGPWLGGGVEPSSHHVRLDLRCGVLVRRATVVDLSGRRTAVVERRIVSMDQPHLVAQEIHFVALNWSGRIEVRAGLDADVEDDETVEDRLLAHHHLQLLDARGDPDGHLGLRVRTLQSRIEVALAARCRLSGPSPATRWTVGGPRGQPAVWAGLDLGEGRRATLEKVVAVYTSRDRAISEPGLAAGEAVAEAPDFAALVDRHRAAWGMLWRQARLEPQVRTGDAGEVRRELDLHLFHVLAVASPHVADLDAGLGARGLHGEGYRGHVFWDTMFTFPVLNLRFPTVSRALLDYRIRRLPAARRAAGAGGRRGAQFPWQSGSDGRDETPTQLFNPRSGRWMPDRSRFQRHVGLSIAYDVWQYWQATGDVEFIIERGAALLIEIARYFADLTVWDPDLGRYRIPGVVGPDEFHDGYPWSTEPGVTDNAYTNVMTAWLLDRATDLLDRLPGREAGMLADRLGLDPAEVARWEELVRLLNVPFHDGVLSQFAGYERLEPLDLAAYRRRYGQIGRLDLILEAEGDAVRRYQVTKQADALMLLYLLSAEELRSVLARMGFGLDPGTIRRTVAYYTGRATGGSSLSAVVHAWVLARGDRRASWDHFRQALGADVAGGLDGTTREGIHLGAMAGTVDLLQRCYAGLEIRDDALWFHPLLPEELTALRFGVVFRGIRLGVDIDHHRFRVAAERGANPPVTLMVAGEPQVLLPGAAMEFPLGE